MGMQYGIIELVNWTLRNKLQLNLIQNKIFIQDDVPEKECL